MKKAVDYESLVENLRDGALSVDESSRIVHANKSAAELFGYSILEMRGMPLTDLMPPKYRPLHLAGMKRFLETGEAKVIGKVVELEGLRKDGGLFPIELSISQTTKTDEGHLFTALVRDITDRKRMERNLAKTNQNLLEQLEEMEKTYRLMMGREKRIIELKEEIEALKQKLFPK